jgi:plastocyanin
MKNIKLTALVLAVGGLLIVAGCGGGSTSRPTITVKPDKEDGGAQVANAGKTGTGGVIPPPVRGPGDLAGVIKYTGGPGSTGLPSGYIDKDAYCTSIKGKIPNQSIVVGQGNGLKNVVIYLDRKPRGYSSAVPKDPVIFDQKFCTFEPHVLTMRAGQTVEVKNNDVPTHNTHTYPNNNPFYNKSLSSGKTDDFVYRNPEKVPVKVKCDVHPWMSAYHVPLDHPFVAITDEKGAFKISGIPSGTYKVNVWQEKGGFLEKGMTITIEAGKTKTLDRSYGAAKLAQYRGPLPKVIVLTQK